MPIQLRRRISSCVIYPLRLRTGPSAAAAVCRRSEARRLLRTALSGPGIRWRDSYSSKAAPAVQPAVRPETPLAAGGRGSILPAVVRGLCPATVIVGARTASVLHRSSFGGSFGDSHTWSARDLPRGGNLRSRRRPLRKPATEPLETPAVHNSTRRNVREPRMRDRCCRIHELPRTVGIAVQGEQATGPQGA